MQRNTTMEDDYSLGYLFCESVYVPTTALVLTQQPVPQPLSIPHVYEGDSSTIARYIYVYSKVSLSLFLAIIITYWKWKVSI